MPATHKSTIKLTPYDKLGRRLQVGDWVRLADIPPAVTSLPGQTRAVFRRALGQTFRIEAFDEYGHAELDVSRKVAKYNWIWVEPEYLVRFRRKRRGRNQATVVSQ
jgi:hypothetical protein